MFLVCFGCVFWCALDVFLWEFSRGLLVFLVCLCLLVCFHSVFSCVWFVFPLVSSIYACLIVSVTYSHSTITHKWPHRCVYNIIRISKIVKFSSTMDFLIVVYLSPLRFLHNINQEQPVLIARGYYRNYCHERTINSESQSIKSYTPVYIMR